MQHRRLAVLWSALSAFILVASISCATAFAQDRSETVWPIRRWQTSTPEEHGMSSAALAKLLDCGTNLGFDSLLIARRGTIVLDAYYGRRAADVPHEVYSAPKAVIRTLAAIVYKDSLLDSLNRSALEGFPERSVTRDLLGGRGIVYSDDNYNSDNSHLVSAIITKLTGMSASDYAQAKLFGPLGIGVSYWGHDPQGVTTGGTGVSLLPTRPAPKMTGSNMTAGYVAIGMGVATLCLAFSSIRNARRYGFIMRGGRFVSPTAEPEMIKRYILGKRAIALAGIFLIIFGAWLILAPETLLALLSQ